MLAAAPGPRPGEYRTAPRNPILMHHIPVCLAALLGAALSAAAQPRVIETPRLRFELSPATGQYELADKQARVVWRSNPRQARFAEATLNAGGRQQRVPLARCEVREASGGLEAVFAPLPEQPEGRVRVRIRAERDAMLTMAWEADKALGVESVRLLDEALWTTDRSQGYAVVPVREGLIVPADSGLAFTNRFGTFDYEGCHMEMFGVVRAGAAALVTWHDPYAALEVRSVVTNTPWAEGRQALLPSLNLRSGARALRIHLLGPGDHVTIGRAYRETAREKGWRVTWEAKLPGHPERADYFGASNFKLWSLLSRTMSEDSTREVSVKVNWTFDEAAQIAEHLKNDLKLDKVLFMMGGWIKRGYDNQHPDILPTAPECGGDAAFAEACRRISALGYVLSLHDNYQDIYRDSPSWSEEYVSKNADGKLTVGGKWAGGRAYITCSKKALELARRPQNLPAVRKLSGARSYFIDTTYAAGLSECQDPAHPLTKWDDMKWKQALSDYARDVFGSFGSECGREWAIPHSDFFEGLTGVSGTYDHNKDLARQLGASVIPLFEIVYRDCIALYGKYGYDPMRASEYVLHHLVIGRPLNYHSVPSHLYWKEPPRGDHADKPAAAAALFCRADNGWAEGLHPLDRFVKNTHEILSPLHELTARAPLADHRFLTPDRKVQRSVFGDGRSGLEVVVNMGSAPFRQASRLGGSIELPPGGFLAESDLFVAFHAANWDGVRYEAAPLFTLRSMDGRGLAESKSVRIYHGFGDARLQFRGATQRVQKEAVWKGQTLSE